MQVATGPLPFTDRSIDLSFSTIVIQHISPPHNLKMLGELFRVSRNAVLVDMPSHKLQPSDPEPTDGIFLLDRADVLRTADAHGFELMALRNFPATATRHYQYLFSRR
jgi:hypothetical protein